MTEYHVTGRPGLPPTHPGEVLRDQVLPALGISVAEAAQQLGVTRQHLHAILRGAKPVSTEMALRLGKFCGNGPDLWINMQSHYDLWHAERDPEVAAELDRIPTVRAA